MHRRRQIIAALVATLLLLGTMPPASAATDLRLEPVAAEAPAQRSDAHPLPLSPEKRVAELEQSLAALEERITALERLLALSLLDVPALVEKTAPAVVSLYQVTPEDEVVSQGTGFLWSADGLIITNAHVVEERELQVKAKFADGRLLDAARLLIDPFLDFAVLNVEGEDFPFLDFATTQPAVGSPVVVIGNAFGYSNSASLGIVSGVDRPSPYHWIVHYPSLQTDAAINHGNSGGPILNAAGQVIAVATWTEGKRVSDSIAFGIPAAQIGAALAKFDPDRGIIRPWLGIAVQEPYWSRGGLSNELGLMINDLHWAGAGVRAGLKRHDFIVAVNDVKVDYLMDLRREVEKAKPGDRITLTVERLDGEMYQRLSIPVVLGEYSDRVRRLTPSLFYDPEVDDLF